MPPTPDFLSFPLWLSVGKRQGHVNFDAQVSAHVVNARVAPWIIRIGFKIFQPAQVILVGGIEKIIAKQVNIQDGIPLFVGDAGSHPRIE